MPTLLGSLYKHEKSRFFFFRKKKDILSKSCAILNEVVCKIGVHLGT